MQAMRFKYEGKPIVACDADFLSIITDVEVTDKLLQHIGIREDVEIRCPPVPAQISSNEVTSEPYYDDWPGFSEI